MMETYLSGFLRRWVLKMWVNISGLLAALICLFSIHTIFVRGFSWLYWLLFPSSSGVGEINIWLYYMNFHQVTVFLGFHLALAYIIFIPGSHLWRLFRENHLPPYRPHHDSLETLPVSLRESHRSRSRKPISKALKFLTLAIGLAVSFILTDYQFLISHQAMGAGLVERFTSSFYGTLFLSLVEFPPSMFTSVGAKGGKGSKIINILHIWVLQYRLLPSL